jgi:phosphatidylglycerophosphatase A
MTLALVFIPLTPASILLAFLFFRFFDILKPLGIGRLDAMKHPSGIMWDDLLAGLYSNLGLRLILFLIPALRPA